MRPLRQPIALIVIANAASMAAPLPQLDAIASANGAGDAATTGAGRSIWMLVPAIRKITADRAVPPMSARERVRSASRILQTGAVAFSKPVIAKKVSAVAVPRLDQFT